MTKFIQIILISFILTGCFNDELVFYKSTFDKKTDKCDGEIYLKVAYKVDIKNQQVMQTFYKYETDELLYAGILNHCKVIDRKNFECKEEDTIIATGNSWAVTGGKHLVKSGLFKSGEKIGKKYSNYDLEICWYTKGIFGKELIPTL